MEEELSTIAKGAGFYFAGFAVSKVLAYIYRAMLARGLGPVDFGILSIGLGVMGFALVFAALGLYEGILHFVAVYESTGKKEMVKGAISLGLKAQFLSSLVFAAAIFMLSDWLALTFFREQSLGIVLKLLSLTIPFSVVTTSLLIVGQAFRRIEYKVYVRNVIENLGKIGFTAFLFFLGFGLFGATIGLVLSSVLAFFASLYFIQRKVFPVLGSEGKASCNWHELFSYSWPLFAIGFFDVIMYSIDTVMLGSLSRAYDAGLYNVAQPTANLLTVAPIAFGSLFLPVITGFYAQGRVEEFKRTFKVVARWIFAFMFPCLLFTMLFSEEILSVMFGSVYAEASSALIVLAAGMFMVSFVGEVRSILESIGRTRLIFWNTIIAGIVNVALNWMLIPLFGATGNAIVGAALATSFSYFLWNLLGLAEVFWLKRMHPYSKAYLQPTVAASISIALFWLGKKYLPQIMAMPTILGFVLLVALSFFFLALYAVLFIVLKGIQKEDLEVLKAVERKLGVKSGLARAILKRFG